MSHLSLERWHGVSKYRFEIRREVRFQMNTTALRLSGASHGCSSTNILQKCGISSLVYLPRHLLKQKSRKRFFVNCSVNSNTLISREKCQGETKLYKQFTAGMATSTQRLAGYGKRRWGSRWSGCGFIYTRTKTLHGCAHHETWN